MPKEADTAKVIYPYKLFSDHTLTLPTERLIVTSDSSYLFLDDENTTFTIGEDPILTSSRQIGTSTLHYNEEGTVASIDLGLPFTRDGRRLLRYAPSAIGISPRRLAEMRAGLRFANIRPVHIKGLGEELGLEPFPQVTQDTEAKNIR